MLGLPENIQGCLFDLDGVLTPTAKVHDAAWKEMFDDFLKRYPGQEPFDPVADYDEYVDGKPRDEGTRSFLESRGIHLDADTITELGSRKNEIVLRRLRDDGVDAYPGSLTYLHAVKKAGLRRAVVSASTNCKQVLEAAGIADLFQARIDGIVTQRDHLHGKPAPDTFLAGAKALGLAPKNAVVFEDALAGVAAGRAGDFGFVVGVDRVGQADALREHGADVVVTDLADLLND
ncbi:MAG TPA: beta-phosphoglucomutase family hydrolase [Streptosporangiaceae bacterium]|nr:beta-phosphoglucomutase family hydrolase [Streptosporangiaceae bacterium]